MLIGGPEWNAASTAEKIDFLDAGRSNISPTRDAATWARVSLLRAELLRGDDSGDPEANQLAAAIDLDFAAVVATMADDRMLVGEILAAQAEALLEQSGTTDLETVLGLARRAITYTRTADRTVTARIYLMIGFCYLHRGAGLRWKNLEKAKSAFKIALRLASAGGLRDLAVTATQGLGEVYLVRIEGEPLRNVGKAQQWLEQAFELHEPTATPPVISCLHKLGLAYLDHRGEPTREHVEAALAAAAAALEHVEVETDPLAWAQLHHVLGKAMAMGAADADDPDFEAGLGWMDRARAVLADLGLADEYARVSFDLATAHLARHDLVGNRADAQRSAERLQQALTVWRPHSAAMECRGAAGLLGHMLVALDDWPGAAAAWQEAADAQEALLDLSPERRHQRLSTRGGGETVSLLAYAYARLGRPEDAAVALEQGRGRTLRNLVGVRQLAGRQDDPEITAAAWKAYREMDRDALAEQGYTGTLQRLRAVLPDFLRPPGWSDLQRWVPAGKAMVYLAVAEYGSSWIVLARDAAGRTVATSVIVDGFDQESLRLLLVGDDGRGRLAAASFGDMDRFTDVLDAVLEQLRVLVEPLAAALDALGVREVVLVPTRFAVLLPLHALLIERATVSFAPSAQMWAAAAATAEATAAVPPRLLAVATPDADPPLPYARLEAQQAAGRFGQSTMMSDEPVSAPQMLAAIADATHVHFACHGQVNLDEPLLSSVELPGGRRLHLTQVLDYEGEAMRCRLVVLSACQTAVVVTRPDEAFILPTGFLTAGAAGAIATLWPVDDLATCVLMDCFYRHLADGQTPVAALRAAQIDMMSMRLPAVLAISSARGGSPNAATAAGSQMPFRHPAFWAGFIHIGA
ncbi:CHAT domain-containing protein [Dactylosporangium sp. NPDC049140]|uniref:CHAT domain-containing protein n=1 Tax=Dactylosporangium sp. NPDC049140 TaxID=3155647 RepID=UPI0033C0ECA2